MLKSAHNETPLKYARLLVTVSYLRVGTVLQFLVLNYAIILLEMYCTAGSGIVNEWLSCRNRKNKTKFTLLLYLRVYLLLCSNQKIITHRCDHKSYLSYYKTH